MAEKFFIVAWLQIESILAFSVFVFIEYKFVHIKLIYYSSRTNAIIVIENFLNLFSYCFFSFVVHGTGDLAPIYIFSRIISRTKEVEN